VDVLRALLAASFSDKLLTTQRKAQEASGGGWKSLVE
jgi:hypothetical protein